MAVEPLFLANQGAQVLRLDAVALIWKQPGSTCEFQPRVHDLLGAFWLPSRGSRPSPARPSTASCWRTCWPWAPGAFPELPGERGGAAEFEGATLIPVSTHNPHVLGYQRPARRSVVLCLANFSDWSQFVTGETLSGFLPAAAPSTRTRRWTFSGASSWRPTDSADCP